MSSDSGHDAASESLDLMLTTTLSRHMSTEPVVHDLHDVSTGLAHYQQSQSHSQSQYQSVRHDETQRRDGVDNERDERCSYDVMRDNDRNKDSHDGGRSKDGHDGVWSADRSKDSYDGVWSADEKHGGRVDVDMFYDAVELSRDAATCSFETHSTVSCETHGTVSRERPDTVWTSGTLCNGRVYDSCVSSSSSSSSSRLSSRLRLLLSSLALSVGFIVCGLIVLTYIVLESDTDVAIVASVRRLPEVCQFYRDHYVPWRNWLIGPHHHHSHWPCVTHRPQGRKSTSERRRSQATV